jgi:polyisoprenoid-binding protein YceI
MKAARLLFLSCILLFAMDLRAASLCVDGQRSRVQIHVGSAGLFGALGHDHSIEANDVKGCAEIDWSQLDRSSVALNFSTAAIVVMDPKHPDDRPKVQETMENEVLRVKDFPEIGFKSDRVRLRQPVSGGSNRYEIIVDGMLTIRGQTRPVSIPLTLTRSGTAPAAEAGATGRYTLKQSDFGIKPISLAGGAVRVKDDIQLDFDLKLREAR